MWGKHSQIPCKRVVPFIYFLFPIIYLYVQYILHSLSVYRASASLLVVTFKYLFMGYLLVVLGRLFGTFNSLLSSAFVLLLQVVNLG